MALQLGGQASLIEEGVEAWREVSPGSPWALPSLAEARIRLTRAEQRPLQAPWEAWDWEACHHLGGEFGTLLFCRWTP